MIIRQHSTLPTWAIRVHGSPCSMQRILVLGAGFAAGLWSAIGAGTGPGLDRAARHRPRPGRGGCGQRHALAFHPGTQLRNGSPAGTRLPLADLLEPIDVKLVVAEVTGLSIAWEPNQNDPCRSGQIPPARLRPPGLCRARQSPRPAAHPGLGEHAFDIDTYDAAMHVLAHISPGSSWRATLRRARHCARGRPAGLTGVEVATEMPARLRSALAADPTRPSRASFLPTGSQEDRGVGTWARAHHRPVIAEALATLGVEARPGRFCCGDGQSSGATLATGERIDTRTVIWCAGMQASLPLYPALPGCPRSLRPLCRSSPALKIDGLANEFAAGDVAWFTLDGSHALALMSCQHGRPMGRLRLRPQRRLLP